MSVVRVAILGANGQIGRALCRAWAGGGRFVPVALVRNRLAEACLRATVGGIEVRRGAISDFSSAGSLLRNCEAVVNCAYASTGGLRASRLANEGLISSVLKVPWTRRLVQLSSVAVYGAAVNAGSSFESPIPDSAYGREKLAHERFALRLDAGRARVSILRIGHVYGAGHVMSRYILEAVTQGDCLLPVKPGMASNAVSERTLIAGIEAALSDGGRGVTLNLVDEPNGTWAEHFRSHAETVGVAPPGGLSPAGAEAVERAALARTEDGFVAVSRELGASLKPVGAGRLVASAAFRSRMDAVIAAAPAGLERALRARHQRAAVAAQISRLTPPFPEFPAWLFSRPVPGPNAAPPGSGPALEDWKELAAWWRRASVPDWDDGQG